MAARRFWRYSDPSPVCWNAQTIDAYPSQLDMPTCGMQSSEDFILQRVCRSSTHTVVVAMEATMVELVIVLVVVVSGSGKSYQR